MASATINARPRKTSKTVRRQDGSIDPDNLTQKDFEVEHLGDCPYPTPLTIPGFIEKQMFDDKDRRIMYDPQVAPPSKDSPPAELEGAKSLSPFTMRVANARANLHFQPSEINVGIVTCGGLCPGLNDVVRALVHACTSNYGVKNVLGFRFGYWGLSAAGRDSTKILTPHTVHNIHLHGGTFLGTSRGKQDINEMVDTLVMKNINVLFTIGGDGTQRGAERIGNEARKRGLNISIMGIPKTIDNDLSFSQRTFGFMTAVDEAVRAIRCAHAEAQSHDYGVGIVKVMGRHSGFIAAQATISSAQVDLCLVPETQVELDTVLQLIEARFHMSNNCVICVAEGFGQDWQEGTGQTDASGNTKLTDIGAFLSSAVSKWMKKHPKYNGGTVKYIDPSYMIRSCPANPSDASFCVSLANLAAHEAMAGVTNAVITFWYSNFIVVPIRLATSLRKELDVQGKTWRQVKEMTVDLRQGEEAARNRKIVRFQRRIAALEEAKKSLERKLAKL